MTSQELVEMLEASRKDLIAAAATIPESLTAVRPGSERWSVKDCVEHLAAVEERFLERLREAKPLAEQRIDLARENALNLAIADRSTRAVAPEPVRPMERFATLADAFAAFNDARSRMAELVAARDSDLYALDLEHRRFGQVNGVEFIIIVSGHTRRHTAQILEVGGDIQA